MVVTALAGIVAAAALAQQPAAQVTADIALSADMAGAARRWLSALTVPQRQRAVFPFAAAERVRWHYIPQPRRGLALGELDPTERHLAYGFLATALGRRGFAKASTIMALEEVLRRTERGAGLSRDPGGYFLSVFGEPSTSATWGWRLEGHHLSVNLTLVDGVRPVEAPVFLGASPAHVTTGLLADTRVLGREESLGRQLLASLDDAQRSQATYRSTAPDDILLGPGAKLTSLPGLPAAKMTPSQRHSLAAILDEVLGNLPSELAAREHARIGAGDDLVFTWAGGRQAGEPHYYRISGASFVYEFDNTQDHANHIHTVWHARAPGGDFGEDLLRAHYRDDHATPPSASDQAIRSEWAQPIEPFRIVGNVYYVGAANVASYLIATSRGLILLDTGPREMTSVVRAGIVKLGFKLEDVKILLTSHAHWDHVEGHAAMKQLTGAAVMALAEEAPALSSGKDLSALGGVGWDPVPVDRVLHDGDDVVLGDVTMHALWTPGHTQGTTTWTTRATEHGRTYAVAFVGAIAANAGVKLLANPRHPTIVEDLARTYRVLKTLKPDIYLTGHPADIFAGKLDRIRAGAIPNPLVDPTGYAALIAEGEADYVARLGAERAAAASYLNNSRSSAGSATSVHEL
ncbi:MAG: subclass B3 metallo-beta-lactamase [Kofleriaceae bacterium]